MHLTHTVRGTLRDRQRCDVVGWSHS